MNALWLWKSRKETNGCVIVKGNKTAVTASHSFLVSGSKLGHTSGLYTVNCLHNLYAEYTMRNAGLGEAQAGIKIAGRNIK